MTSLLRARWLQVTFASCVALCGCSGDDEPAPIPETSDGSAECAVIGELCHESDSGSGDAHDCHETGHIGDGAVCLSAFADCVALCVPEDDDGDAGGSQADAHCAALGELCHPVDDHDGPLHECHELGHENDAAACAKAFEACSTQCLAARETLEAEGAGGAAQHH